MRDLPTSTFPPPAHSAFAAPWPSALSAPPATAQCDAPTAPFDVAWARHDNEVAQAQQLRHLVFATELGAGLTVPPSSVPGHDIDVFDPFCEHLLVREPSDGGDPGPVVGTCRVLTPASAKRVGGLESDVAFDLTRLRPLRPRLVEVGRACVHPAWRSHGVTAAMWSALVALMQRNHLDTMISCAKVGMEDGGHAAASLWRQLSQSHLAPIEWHVRPRLPLPVDELQSDSHADAPPLIKAYLRCGARVLGAPAWEPHLNTADLPMLLRLRDLPARYDQHLSGA